MNRFVVHHPPLTQRLRLAESEKKRMITVTPAALTEALQRLTEQHPDYRLSKIPNTGNLAIVDPDGLLRGYVDVYDASLNWYDFPEL